MIQVLLEADLTTSQKIIAEVLTALIPVAIVALLALIKKPVRNFLLYQRTEYDFVFSGN